MVFINLGLNAEETENGAFQKSLLKIIELFRSKYCLNMLL